MKSKNNLRHYFISSEHSEDDYFQFEHKQLGEVFKFTSCGDVFSKNEIDYGSQVLINTIVKEKEFYTGKILDMCCGYGTIAIILSKFLNAQFDGCDINTLAIKLANVNIKHNSAHVDKIFVSDMWSEVPDKYNHVVSNPPIKVGKSVLIKFLDGLFDHVEANGSVTIVIKKNLGADSTKRYLEKIFGNCEVLNRDKGYYILRSIKH